MRACECMCDCVCVCVCVCVCQYEDVWAWINCILVCVQENSNDRGVHVQESMNFRYQVFDELKVGANMQHFFKQREPGFFQNESYETNYSHTLSIYKQKLVKTTDN